MSSPDEESAGDVSGLDTINNTAPDEKENEEADAEAEAEEGTPTKTTTTNAVEDEGYFQELDDTTSARPFDNVFSFKHNNNSYADDDDDQNYSPTENNTEFTSILNRLTGTGFPSSGFNFSGKTSHAFKRLAERREPTSFDNDAEELSEVSPTTRVPESISENIEGAENEENTEEEEEEEEEEDNRNGLPEPVQRSGSPSGRSTPDDTPSIHASIRSSTAGSVVFRRNSNNSLYSPAPSLRPFDRRFSSRMSPSPSSTPRASSPAFLKTHSRSSSLASQLDDIGDESNEATTPWDVVRWTRLKKINSQVFSESGRRGFGNPTCINVSAHIALGTSKGLILIFDYHQTLKAIIGQNTKAVESGPITTLAVSADYTTIAGGHGKGDIFTWEISKPNKPFLQIAPIPLSRSESDKKDGHVEGAAILHLGFLGTRHTALVSADDKGMAFSHLASRSLVGRVVKTKRILGRYPFDIATNTRPRKPSSVLGFAALPLGNSQQVTDNMGLVAMLTPYLLVIVSTTPVAQTQHKVARPKEVANEAALSGCLAWFPAVKPKQEASNGTGGHSMKTRLAYCWSNVLTILEVSHMESSDPNELPQLSFRAKKRWKCEEAIVAVQWLNKSILGILTVTQRLYIVEEPELKLTDKFDLVQKNIFHFDFFSRQLRSLVGRMDEEAALHTSIADAYYNSFKSFKGRMFLMGFNECSVGTLSNWADRLLALMEVGDFVGAIQLATDYYNGETEKITVGLPDNDDLRHYMVQEKLVDMIAASLRFAFGPTTKGSPPATKEQIQELALTSFKACLSMKNMDFLFDTAFEAFLDGGAVGIFLETLEPHILDRTIRTLPPIVIKSLISQYTSLGFENRLEEILCHLEPETMDIHQVTTLCKENNLYDALIYVWNRAIGDYITPLVELLVLLKPVNSGQVNGSHQDGMDVMNSVSALKLFPYLSYILTGRIYPTGDIIAPNMASDAKAAIYYFLFLGRTITWPKQGGNPFLTNSQDPSSEPTFPYLRLILEFDAASFLSALNEAFEDSFLNGTPAEGTPGPSGTDVDEEQIFGRSVNRQYIVQILTEVMNPSDFAPDEIVYLDMFIARNLPKYPQYLLLSGSSLHRVLVGLCEFPGDEIADDRQLSVEYLLSVYHPPDVQELVELCTRAKFYRVLKSLFRSEKQYSKLLKTFFYGEESRDGVFECISDCLRPGSGVSLKQTEEIKAVIKEHAAELVHVDVARTASILENLAEELHDAVLLSIGEERRMQFLYLQTILEPKSGRQLPVGRAKMKKMQDLIELYIRLMCEFEPTHVSDYVETLRSGDLDLPKVLPAMEESGIMDAVVRLMAREGQIREAMDKLVAHLGVLESTTIGLLQASLDEGHLEGYVDELNKVLKSLQKFSNVGIWLCQGQMRSSLSKNARQRSISRRRSEPDITTMEEVLWLDLIDVDVRIAKNASALLRTFPRNTITGFDFEHPARSSSFGTTPPSPSVSVYSGVSAHTTLSHSRGQTRLVHAVRRLVQDVFTALLTSTAGTSSPHASSVSFLHVLRAFLNRASMSSPSLADLRNVLAGIFDAYMYEEQLLSLANGLLDKNLFLHVQESANLRLHGWRPHGQTCDACGKKLWGAGAAGNIYSAWEKERNKELFRHRRASTTTSRADEMSDVARGKIRASPMDLVESENYIKASTGSRNTGYDAEEGDEGVYHAVENTRKVEEHESGDILIFSCKHIFHQQCLEKLGASAERNDDTIYSFACILCK